MEKIELKSKIIILAYVLVVCLVMFFSSGLLESGDGLAHYQISKYSWDYPLLLLDHWGKPLFTLLSSPFAQLGYNGMIAFNMILAVFTAFLLLRVAKCWAIQRAWLAVIILFCAPIYYRMIVSGMTEILFAFALLWSVERLLAEKYAWAAIIISFLPFMRPEAYIVGPFLALYLLSKSWKSIPFLLLGNLCYGLVGLIALDDFLWFFHNDPYAHQDPGAYGFGEPFSFLKRSHVIAGWAGTILFLFGAAYLTIQLFQSKLEKISSKQFCLLFILPTVLVYVGHSYMWAKGLKGSYGLVRVIATVLPLSSLVAAKGIDSLLNRLKERKLRFRMEVLLLLVFLIIWIDKSPFLIDTGKKEGLVIEASDWVKEQYPERKIFYLHPMVSWRMELNPYDESSSYKIWGMDKDVPSNSMKSGDILFWDAHYSPQEGRMPKEAMEKDSGLTFVKEFQPDEPMEIFGNRLFEIYIYEAK